MNFKIIILSASIAISMTNYVKADPLPNGWIRVSGTPVSLEEASSYYSSKTNPAISETTIKEKPVSRTMFTPMGGSSPSTIISEDEVADLARALNYDPLLMFNFVNNNINYSPYFGVLKGPEQTLIDKNGNDFDQAALLVELLTDSGYTANFMYGTMSMPRVGLANWLNVDATFTRIEAVLTDGGIPYGSINSTNDTLDVQRVWVEANISGTNYVFDPAYKQYDYKTGINIATATGYSQSTLLSAVESGATITSNYVQNLNESSLRSQLATYSNNLISTIRSSYPNAAVSDIIGGRSIHQTQLTSLATSLPFTTSSVSTWSSISSTYDATVEIQYDGIDYTFPTAQIAGKRLTITYSSSGNDAQLSLDGSVVATGSATTLGSTSNMTVIITHPYTTTFANQTSTYPLVSGSTYAIASDFGGGVGNAIITKRQQVANEAAADGNSSTSEPVLGETLNVIGLTWLKELQATGDIINQLAQTRCVRHHSIGVVAQESGYYINVASVVESEESQHDATSNAVAGAFSAIGFGSAFENGVLEEMTGSSVQALSTVKILELANSGGHKIYGATSSNWSSIESSLTNYTTGQLSTIGSYVTAGYTVYLPDNGLISLNHWEGAGFLVEDWGSVLGYIISGAYFGGYASTTGTLNVDTVQTIDQNNYVHVNQTSVPTYSAAEPVDMTTGAFMHDNLDLSLGKQAPLGLAFSSHYLNSSNLVNKMMGYGWTHGYDIRLTQQSDPDPVLGFRLPVDAASLITAAYIVQDVLTSQNNLTGWTTSSLIQKWAIDQILNNAFDINIGTKVLTYVQLTDGTYSPPPGVTTNLIYGSGTYSLKERFGTTMNFDTNNRVTSITDLDGNSMSFSYTSDLLSSVTDQFGRSLTLSYSSGLLTSVSDSASRSVSYGYDSNDNLTSFTDAAGKVWQFTYDLRHRMATITNPLSVQTISNTYDGTGAIMTQVAPRQGGGTGTYNFFFTGTRNAEENPFSKFTIYNIDSLGRTVSVEDALGDTSSTSFDGQNHPVLLTDPLGNETTLTYDGNNDLTTIEDALSHSTTNGYNSAFDLTSVTDPLTHETTFSYDSNHHLLNTIDPLSDTTAFTYYSDGFLDTITDPLSVVTTKTYDSYGNPATTKTASHPDITTGYDTIGRMTSLEDQVGSTTSFGYDARSLLLNRTDPLGKETYYTYDDAGNLSSVEDRNSHTINYSYTPTNNVDTITYPDSSTVHFTYDQDDKLTGMVDALGTSSYGYDDAKRLTSYANAFGSTVAYGYDAAGNVTSLTYPGSKVVSYTYDALNRIHTVTNWLSQTATYTYDNAGRLTELVNFNGTITNYTYDNANRLTGLAYTTSSSTPLLNYTFTLDANGNRTQISQLEPLSTTISLGTTSYAYNTAKNRLTTFAGLSFSYDNEGQTTAEGSASYGFDFEHRVTSMPGATFSYDGASRRLKADRYGAETHYIYDASGNLLAEANNANTIIRYYIYGAGLLAMVDAASGNIYCYHFNATGSTIALTNSSQAIVNSYAYTPFGQVTEQQTVIQPFKYVGQYGVMQEPNGLYYMRARYYDPMVGRFISEDPSGFSSGQINLYTYANNSPVNYYDINGRWAIDAVVGAGSGFLSGFSAGAIHGNVFAGIAGGVVGGAVGGTIGAFVPDWVPPQFTAVTAKIAGGVAGGATGGFVSTVVTNAFEGQSGLGLLKSSLEPTIAGSVIGAGGGATGYAASSAGELGAALASEEVSLPFAMLNDAVNNYITSKSGGCHNS